MHRHLILLSICPLTSHNNNKCHSEEIKNKNKNSEHLHDLIITLEACENIFKITGNVCKKKAVFKETVQVYEKLNPNQIKHSIVETQRTSVTRFKRRDNMEQFAFFKDIEKQILCLLKIINGKKIVMLTIFYRSFTILGHSHSYYYT